MAKSEVTNVETNVEKPAETVTLNEFKDPYQYDFLLDRINEMIKSNNSSLGEIFWLLVWIGRKLVYFR